MKRRVVIMGLIVVLFAGVYAAATTSPALRQGLVNAWQLASYPFRLAHLSSQPADTTLLMPVDEVRIRDIADTWGAPRSGGRSHEGQDIFAPRDTPIRSAVTGYVTRISDSTLGGNSVFVTGAGGVRYYYTHLDAFAEDLTTGMRVTPDTILGFVGNSGNACNHAAPPALWRIHA